jgi:D-apiose dehydrogenase
MNPVICGEDMAQLFVTFESGATALWDANRYNETDAEFPRYTFGQLRMDATGGHLAMSSDSTIVVKRLGEPQTELPYSRERKNFAGDCVYAVQRHFVDCVLTDDAFESSGDDYLKTIRVVEAAYGSARTGQVVHCAG